MSDMSNHGRSGLRWRLVAGVLAGCVLAIPAAAQDAATYFKGKTVRVLVGSPAGGGYDLSARLIAPHLAKRLGATVIVENKPGGGALLALSYMLVQPRDGLLMMMASAEAAIMSELLGRDGTTWDVAKLNWLAKVSTAPKLWFVGPQSKFTSAADAIKASQVIWPATAQADNISDIAAIISHVLGLRSKIVVGYKGAGDMSLAVIRNEADAGILSADTALQLVTSGQIKPIAVFDDKRWRHLPAVPTLAEAAPVAADKAWMSELRRQIGEAQRALAAAPGVPADRIAYLRAVLADILTDPAVIEEAARSNREIDFLPGAALQQLIANLMGAAGPRLPEFRRVVLDSYF